MVYYNPLDIYSFVTKKNFEKLDLDNYIKD